MSKFNKIISSIGQNKTIRSGVIAAALLGAMTTTQSCKDNKNAGMPVHADAIEIESGSFTDTTDEAISIEDNFVEFGYTFDSNLDAPWNQKNIDYGLTVNRSSNGPITAILEGSTYYGAESDRGAGPENNHEFRQEFEYTSLEDFNARFTNEITRYVSTVMDNLQNNAQTYSMTDDISINEEANNEVQKKTSQLAGYLKYKMNAHELSVVKQGDEVVLPITRNGNRFDFVIKENTTGIQLQGKDKKVSKMYDITMKQGDKMTTLTTALSKDDLKFAEELTKSFEKLLKVGDIPQEIEDEAFLGKGLEAKQLLDKN